MSKSAEANNYIKKAEKCMKTSLLKWSSDTEGALENYTKAAECFKQANDLNNAIETYRKIADMHIANDSLFYSAKALEEAAMLYKSIKNYQSMVNLILEAGDKLRINGNSEGACHLIKRTAKAIEEESPADAATLYKFGSEAAQDNESLRDAGEFAGLAAKYLVRADDLAGALVALQSKANLLSKAGAFHEAGKAVVCQVVVHLYNNDFVAASKAYSSSIEENSFGSTEDSSPVNQLLNAYDKRLFDEVRTMLRGPTFMYLENDFVKLARSIKLPEAQTLKMGDEAKTGESVSADAYEEDIN